MQGQPTDNNDAGFLPCRTSSLRCKRETSKRFPEIGSNWNPPAAFSFPSDSIQITKKRPVPLVPEGQDGLGCSPIVGRVAQEPPAVVDAGVGPAVSVHVAQKRPVAAPSETDRELRRPAVVGRVAGEDSRVEQARLGSAVSIDVPEQRRLPAPSLPERSQPLPVVALTLVQS